MKFLSTLIVLLFSMSSWSSELMLTGGMSFNHTNILGQSDVPSSRGKGYFGEFEYLMPIAGRNALSIFGVYHDSTQENTANDEVMETINIGYFGGGLKLYVGSFSISASVGRVSFQDKVTGAINKNITSNETGQEVGIGYRLKLSELTGIVIGAHALHSSLNPANGDGFYEDYDIWQYRVSIGINFILPSGPSESRRSILERD
jgi:hypothetical protein